MLMADTKIINGDSLEVLKSMPSECVDMVITSPPYWSLRDYGVDGQLGEENTFEEYLDKLICIFNEVYRVLKPTGSCWVNIGDVYSSSNKIGVRKQSLLCIPDRFKIAMVNSGWLCRNEIIWHKPNAMPSSAKTRFNNDYEKMFFFTKDDLYYFSTQYEEATSKPSNSINKRKTKYTSIEQETSVRQGMHKDRGNKLIEVRPNLPYQQEFVSFIRNNTTVNAICNSTNIKRTKVEHWFRKDVKGFAFPSVEDWKTIRHLLSNAEGFEDMDYKLTHTEYETDDINKNINKGRIKRAVWSICTKPYKGCHFAPFPEELVTTPIKACCPPNGIVMDIFCGSGTTGVVAKKLGVNFIGIEINKEYCDLALNRIYS